MHGPIECSVAIERQRSPTLPLVRLPLTTALKAVADDLGRSLAEVALSWTLHRPGVASTLIGARTVSQLENNLAAGDLTLDRDHLTRLDAASAPVPGFTASLAALPIRRMVFGGHDVVGWR